MARGMPVDLLHFHIVHVDADVASVQVKAGVNQGEDEQLFHFFLVDHRCLSHCRDMQTLSGGRGEGSGSSSSSSKREAGVSRLTGSQPWSY